MDSEASTVVIVTAFSLTVPPTADAMQLEQEIVTALAERLRDEHGFKLSGSPSRTGPATSRYGLQPAGSIMVDREQAKLTVTLQGISDMDARDLFTGVSSSVEQRHEGLEVEIG